MSGSEQQFLVKASEFSCDRWCNDPVLRGLCGSNPLQGYVLRVCTVANTQRAAS